MDGQPESGSTLSGLVRHMLERIATVGAAINTGIVAALHAYFLVLEMFFWTKPLGLSTFRMTLEKAQDSAVLAANQGLYNGFLAAGLLYGIFAANGAVGFQFKVFDRDGLP